MTPPYYCRYGSEPKHFVCRLPNAPGTKIAKFANSIELDEVAHYEPPHLDLHCLPCSLLILNMKYLDKAFFKICRRKFVV